MVKENVPQAAVEEKAATDAQLKLIRDLMAELSYAILPEKWEGKALNRTQASEVVHYLKESKVRDQALRSQNAAVPQFDKIGFGMVYKLVWRACSETPLATKPSKQQFTDMVIGEYEVFKDAQAACKEYVKDGGLE